MTKLKIAKKKNPKPHDTTNEVKSKLRYWRQKSQENTKTRKTQAGTHNLGPNIEKHKNTQNTENTFGHSQPHNEPHMQFVPFSLVLSLK